MTSRSSKVNFTKNYTLLYKYKDSSKMLRMQVFARSLVNSICTFGCISSPNRRSFKSLCNTMWHWLRPTHCTKWQLERPAVSPQYIQEKTPSFTSFCSVPFDLWCQISYIVNLLTVGLHCVSITGPLRLIGNNFTNSQHLLIIFGRVRPYSILNSLS